MEIQTKRLSYLSDVVLQVDQQTPVFSFLSDLGTVDFQLFFEKDKIVLLGPEHGIETKKTALKKILSMPLTAFEMMSVLLFDLGPGFQSTKTEESITWNHRQHKKLRVEFKDFRRVGKAHIPFWVRVTYKKRFFEIQWTHIDYKP